MHCEKGVALLVAGLLAAVLTAGPAAALESGVHVAPGSPAGKEYSFPLSVLRAQGAGKVQAVAGIVQPLFGVGITPAGKRRVSAVGSRPPGRSSTHGVRTRGGRARGSLAGTPGSDRGGRTSTKGEAALIRLAQPGSSLASIVLIIVLVLVVGLAIGTGIGKLRRWS